MKQAKVLVADEVDELLLEELRKYGLRVVYRPGIARSELLKEIRDYEVLVVRGRLRVDSELLANAPKLKVIARAGSGLDNVDVEAAAAKGVKVVNAPEGAVESVAELTIGLMLCAARLLPQLYINLKRGLWRRSEGFELLGKTLLVVGFGRIGSRVAVLAKRLGMKVVAYDKRDVSDACRVLGIELAESLHRALGEADVVSLHVPLTPETYHMFGKREFKAMKKGAILVNTSRGAVVDPEALLWALEKGIVSVAALDVLEEEPPRSELMRKLVEHPRVIVTPHIGAQTREAQRRIAKILAPRIVSALRELSTDDERAGGMTR